MAPASSSPPEGPLNFSGTAREAWRFYRLRPVLLMCLFGGTYVVVGTVGAAFSTMGRGSVGQAIGGIAVNVALPIVGSFVTAVACVIVHDASLGRRTGLKAALDGLRGSWRDLASAALLAAITAILANTLLFVLSQSPLALLTVFLLPSLSVLLFGPPLLVHAISLERLSLIESWTRARDLVSGNWRRFLGHALLLAFVLGAVILLATVLAQSVGASGLPLLGLTVVVYGVLIPFVVTFMLAAFLDLRAQRDRRPAG